MTLEPYITDEQLPEGKPVLLRGPEVFINRAALLANPEAVVLLLLGCASAAPQAARLARTA